MVIVARSSVQVSLGSVTLIVIELLCNICTVQSTIYFIKLVVYNIQKTFSNIECAV